MFVSFNNFLFHAFDQARFLKDVEILILMGLDFSHIYYPAVKQVNAKDASQHSNVESI